LAIFQVCWVALMTAQGLHYVGQGGCVLPVFICLSVCLAVSRITEKLLMTFDKCFLEWCDVWLATTG